MKIQLYGDEKSVISISNEYLDNKNFIDITMNNKTVNILLIEFISAIKAFETYRNDINKL